MFRPSSFAVTLVLLTPIFGKTLFVADTGGSLTTLTLAAGDNGTSLAVSSVTEDCKPNPSWLNLDFANRMLYCLDRGISNSTNGSINSFSIGQGGNLTLVDRVLAPFSGVSAEFFSNEAGRRGLATASYNPGAISVISTTDDGHLDGPLQQIYPTLAATGPVPDRQDHSYMHQVLLDPEHRFLVMNDLGGDMVRIFTWDEVNLAPLTEQEPLRTDPGVGPRHGVFRTSPTGTLYYYFVGELSQFVYTYEIEYTNSSLAWTKISQIPALGPGNEKPANTAPPSEIALSPDNRFIIVSNREISFVNSTQYQSRPSDTLSTFSIAENGTLSLVQRVPSGGYSPRQFALNKAGDQIAVGHQGNRTVIIWNRDVETGKIVEESPAALIELTGAVVCTIWDE